MATETSHPTRKVRGFVHEGRYVVAVDGQRKSSYADESAAFEQARKIQQAYPRLNVEVHDQETDLETLLNEGKEKPNPAPWP